MIFLKGLCYSNTYYWHLSGLPHAAEPEAGDGHGRQAHLQPRHPHMPGQQLSQNIESTFFRSA